MYSIDKVYKLEIVIQKSRFICILYPLNNKNIDNILSEIKNEYKGATHYCYALITSNYQKYSDDGEPNGTAGNPILNVLKKKDLINVLAIVVRYFGGIKLGAGGLVRAYTKVVSDCLSKANIIINEKKIILKITTTYDNLKNIYSLTKENDIIEKTFDETISLIIKMPVSKYNLIKNNLKNICISIVEKEII